MQSDTVILRINDAIVQKHGLNKLVGNIPLSSFVDLITSADLDANPRQAKKSSVTDDIEESLETEGDIFHLMSKGVLVAARQVEELDRNRYRLTFEDAQLEGILDGGHNTLAIGFYALKQLFEDGEAVVKKIRRWDDFRAVWDERAEEIHARKKTLPDTLVPVEIAFPSDDEGGEEYFEEKILRINAARNNNAQLTEEAKANKRGNYEEIKANLDEDLVDEVEWKTNDGGRLKVRELVALAMIPLSVLPNEELPTRQIASSPATIFSQKGQCVQLYNDLLDTDGVTKTVKGDIVEIVHPGVKSALKLMEDIPALYDRIYELLPDAYNSASPGFGRMSCVRLWGGKEKHKENKKKYLSKQPVTKFYQTAVDVDYPEGFVYPILYALRALMEYEDGEVTWKVEDPFEFVEQNLDKVMAPYQSIIQASNYDPAKVGKSTGAYKLLETLFESAHNQVLLAELKRAKKKA